MTGTSNRIIALSAGGDKRELAEYGLGIEHVDELMVRLSRQLLQSGYRLAYGGTLGDPDAKLTELLIDAAVGWLHDDANRAAEVTDPSSWPLVNYGAWPYHTRVSPERKAQLVGICHFVEVAPPHVHQDALAGRLEQWNTDPIARRYVADALTHMREVSTAQTDLRIVWGGRIHGAEGWMAGIAEEVFFSLKLKKPLLILGGFGGCARVLADFLLDLEARWPKALTLEEASKHKTYAERIENDAHRSRLATRFEDLKASVTKLREDLQAAPDIFGVPSSTLREALETTSPRRAIGLAQEAARLGEQAA